MRGCIFKKIINAILCNTTLLLFLFLTIFSSCSDIRHKEKIHYISDAICEAGTCHTATPLSQYPPVSGKHAVHLDSRTGIFCNDCHNGYDNNPLHKNGIFNGYISKTNTHANGDIIFFKDSTNPSGGWDNITSTCSNLRCHLPNDWFATGSAECTFCHSAGLIFDPSSNGKHTQHSSIYNCEVCHSGYGGASTHKDGTLDTDSDKLSLVSFGGGFSGTFNDSANSCESLSCHRDVAWTATLGNSCDVCHYPGSLYNPSSGAHTKHTVTFSYTCEKCHYNYNTDPKHKDGTFDSPSGSPNEIRFDSFNPSGSYTPGGQLCNNLYCHGNFTGGNNTSPAWTGTVNCTTGMCHNNPQTYTSHNRHTVDYSYTCSQCHKDRGYNTAYHINGARDVNFDSFNPSGSYSSPNCSNLYCHGNFTGGNNASPAWGGTVVCAAGCHNNPHTYTTHNKHTSLPYSYACSTCHFNRGYATSYHLNGTKEVNFNPGGLATRNGLDTNTPAYNDGSKVCNDVYCHSNGISADRATDGTYTWGPLPFGTMSYASPAWNGSDFTDCDNCHAGPGYMYTKGPAYIIIDSIDGNMISSDFFVGRDEFPNSGSHRNGAHFDNDRGTYLDNNTQWAVVQCFWCHETDGNDPSGGNKRQGTYGTSFHVDGQTHFIPTHYYDGGTMVGNTLLNMKDTAYDYSGGHCATVSWRCW